MSLSLCRNNSGRSEQNYSNFLVNSNMNYSKADESFSQMNSSLINTSCFPNMISSSNDHLSNVGAFPLNSASYSNCTSSLLQTLFDTDDSQQSLLDYSSSATNYHQPDSNGLILPNFPKPSPMLNQLQPNSRCLWNADFTQAHNFLPSSLNNKRPNQPNFGAKVLIYFM